MLVRFQESVIRLMRPDEAVELTTRRRRILAQRAAKPEEGL